jgi:DNA mismatch repair protein MutL
MKIAAGEVIEGPFSVVRELVDNAIDAGSTQIRVVTSNGGKDYIQVTDNGTGMSEEDATLSVLKHTTSKITRIDDLSSITSMGFRGEALSSICAVSDFTMITMEHDHGVRLHTAYGTDATVEPAAANPGTTVTVRNIFQNLPARKKFLKSNRSEASRVKDEVVKKAISFHQCGFTYKNDDRVVFSLQPRENLSERLSDLFGDFFGKNLISCSFEDDLVSIRGFISNSRHSLANRSGQYLFVNNRPVTDRSLLFALNSPCRGIVQAGRYVYAFIFVRIDPEYLDINVHPAKKEVKIKPSDRLYSAVYHAVSDALQSAYYGEAGGNMQTEHAIDRESVTLDSGAVPGYTQDLSEARDTEGKASLIRESGLEGDVTPGLYAGGGVHSPVQQPVDKEEQTTQQNRVIDVQAEKLQYRGSIFNTFLIFEHDEDVVIVDQHAAHERVYYEQFSSMYEKGSAVKTLLVPINFTPPAGAFSNLADAIDMFKEAGIEIEPFGDESFNVLTLPAFIPDSREEATLSKLLDELYAGKLLFSAEQIRDSFVQLAACRSAVKEGDPLSPDEAVSLMRDVLATRIPFVCPHGRPTMVMYSRDYFDKQFGRR